jgi:DNA replication and repair protein RecF
MLLVGASSFGVVEGGPKIRRALIDRVAFHVEPDFLFSLRLLNEALEQRNAVLRRSGGGSEIQFWENQIEIHANRISDIRQDCISRLNNLLRDNTRKGLERGSISLRYRRGWADGRNLAEVLKENRRRDFATGSTTAGPQRAEIEIRVAETLAARVASRGQIKTIVVSIVCELLRLIASKRGNRPMLLLDDIAAELDEAAVSEALDSIRDTGAQVFITALNDNLRTHLDSSSDKAFHVKRGLVDETTTTSR